MASEPAMAAQTIRVLVADSSRIHTELMSEALRRDPALTVIPWDLNLTGLVPTAIAEDVDVVAVSCSMTGQPLRGLDLVRDLLAVRPAAKSVVLLDSQDRDAVVEAFRAGARGVFSREGSVENFCKCIHCVYHGQIWANTREVGFVLEALATSPKISALDAKGLNLLSKRETEVVRCLAQGLTNREIAERMGLSQHTIKNYLFRVFDKLGVSSRVELLFMTLSEPGPKTSVKHDRLGLDHGRSIDEIAVVQKAAEAGLPAAQLALAQMYSSRTDPKDLVCAYTWYLIATEQVSHSKRIVATMLTPQQINEAQDEARSWLSQTKPPSTPLEDELNIRSSMPAEEPN